MTTYVVSFKQYTDKIVAIYDSIELLQEGLPHNHATLAGDLLEGDGFDNDGVWKWGWKLGDIETTGFDENHSFPISMATSTATWYHEGHNEPSYTELLIERWTTNWYESHFFEN